MSVIQCHVDDKTMAILEYFAHETGRTVDDLAESCIQEGALNAIRGDDAAYAAITKATGQ